jgi:hypothetical protein
MNNIEKRLDAINNSEENHYSKEFFSELNPVFQQKFFGNWIESKCSVQDNNGNHCPDKPTHFICMEYGKEVCLCERCYVNYLNGLYEYRNQINRNRVDS